MISKEEFRSLVESTSKRLGKSQEELAIGMGYGSNYISESLTPTGTLSKKLVDKFRLFYGLENPNSPYMDLGDFRPTIKDYFEEVRGERDFLRKILESSLAGISTDLASLLQKKTGGAVAQGGQTAPAASSLNLKDSSAFGSRSKESGRKLKRGTSGARGR